MTRFDQMADRVPDRFAVVGGDHVLRHIERGRSHADIAAADGRAETGELVVLGNRRQQHHAIGALAFKEAADFTQHLRVTAVDGVDQQLEFGVAQHLQKSVLHAQHHLRIGIVVDQRDHEVPAQRQRTRLRIGRITQLGDHLLDALARVLVQEVAVVDDAADRLLRNAGETRDVVDGGLGGLGHGASIATERSCLPAAFRRTPAAGVRPMIRTGSDVIRATGSVSARQQLLARDCE